MPRFDRYLIAQLLMLFGFFALILVSVYWVNRAVVLFEEIIGDGQSALVFLEITILTLPNVIRLVLPVAAFAATVYVTNRMTSESELVVVQAMGYSGFRLARPVLIFALFVTALVSVLNHSLVPRARAILSERRAEISQDVTARLLVPGQFIHPSDGVTFFIDDISETGELRDVFLSDATRPDRVVTYTAERALLVPGTDGAPTLIMFDGMAQTLLQDSQRLSTTSFDDSVYDIGAMLGGTTRDRVRIEELPTPVLLAAPEAIAKAARKSRAVMRYEGHARISQPFLAVAGSLIGFSALLLGGFSRFGVGWQIMLAITLLIVLQLLDNGAADLARREPALWPLIYAPPVVGCLLAMALLWLAGHPGLLQRRRADSGADAGQAA